METAQIEQELSKALEGEVRFDPYSRAIYSTDASIYQIEPLGVVMPRSKEDVIATVELGPALRRSHPAQGRRHQPGRPDRWAGHSASTCPST